jgi:hypothetical protein
MREAVLFGVASLNTTQMSRLSAPRFATHRAHKKLFLKAHRRCSTQPACRIPAPEAGGPVEPAPPSTAICPGRRALLQSLTIGGLYAMAGRSIFSTDAALASATSSEDLGRQLERRVAEFTLSNGLHFIVLERRAAPVVSFHTYADVGAFDEKDGQTGEFCIRFGAVLLGFFRGPVVCR